MESFNLGISNRDSIGKYFRKKSLIYLKDPNATDANQGESFQEYLKYYIDNGTKLCNLAFADFYLKNGLSYRGLITQEKLLPGQPIYQVPRNLILSTTDAYFSELHEIFEKNMEYFIPANSWAWEYRMLILYILYEYPKGKDSKWHQMISNFPSEIDYLCFWPEDEINALEDDDFIKEVKQEKEFYLREEKCIIEFANKYPDVFDTSVFTADNVRWIWTQILSRKFGWMRNTKYVTLCPFGEFLNHHCSRLQYDSIFEERELADPLKGKEMSEDQLNDLPTTEGSDECRGPILELDLINEDNQFTENVHFIAPVEIEEKVNSILASFSQYFGSRNGFEILFINKISMDIQNTLQAISKDELSLQEARKILENIQLIVQKYSFDVQKFNDKIREKPDTSPDFTERHQVKFKEEAKQQKENPFKGMTADTADDKFHTFELRLSNNEQFEPGSQILLLYGKVTNRYLLLEYGVAIENNKYDYYILKLPYLETLKHNQWIISQLQQTQMPNFVNFKLKWTYANISFINYLKGLIFDANEHSYDSLLKPSNIDFEIQAIRLAIDIIKEKLDCFSKSQEEHEAILEDKQTSYHAYFITCYKLERQKLLKFNQQNLEILILILRRIKDGFILPDACKLVAELETEEEYKRNRHFLRKYLNYLNETLLDS